MEIIRLCQYEANFMSFWEQPERKHLSNRCSFQLHPCLEFSQLTVFSPVCKLASSLASQHFFGLTSSLSFSVSSVPELCLKLAAMVMQAFGTATIAFRQR